MAGEAYLGTARNEKKRIKKKLQEMKSQFQRILLDLEQLISRIDKNEKDDD